MILPSLFVAATMTGSFFPSTLTDISALIAAATAREPPIAEVQAHAVAHAHLEDGRIHALRTGAAWKGALPVVDISGGYTTTRLDEDTILDEYSATDPWVVRGAGGNASEVRVRLSWDLARIAYNGEELDVGGLDAAREKLLVRVTKMVGERRRLLVALRGAKTDDERVQLQLALDESAALLSALTGGWFEQELAARRGE